MRAILLVLLVMPALGGRGGRGRKKGGGGKNTLPFGNVDEYSVENRQMRHPDGAHILKGCHSICKGYKSLISGGLGRGCGGEWRGLKALTEVPRVRPKPSGTDGTDQSPRPDDEIRICMIRATLLEGAHILKGSHWTQLYRLGFKILLVCIAEGKPIPSVTWYKDGAELYPMKNAHMYENRTGLAQVYSKIEIDPAAMGDQGIYSCLANNKHGLMVKNFRCEYTY